MSKQGASSFLWLLIMLAGVTILSFWFLFIDFQGLSHPRGMEQATIARQIARGEGITTKNIRGLALQTVEQDRGRDGDDILLKDFPNTIHAPLNPLIQSLVLSASRNWWEVDDDPATAHLGVYQPDRVLTALAVVFFIASIGVNFLLLSRMFDATIAGFTSLVLIACEMLWRFTQTGMPQMLMLLLFSLGCLFLHSALERGQDNRNPLVAVAVAAICFALLCLAKWLCLWIALGALVFVGLNMRPRALCLSIFGLVLLPGIVWWMVAQGSASGKPTGIAFLAPLTQVQSGHLQDDDIIMRAYSEQSKKADPKDLPARLALSTANQAQDIFRLLGGVVAAPLFFLALLQPFRRPSTSTMRWGVLLMWILAAIGMSFYGLHGRAEVANQLHFLFIPIMSGYGFAMVAVLWNRLNVPSDLPLRRIMPLLILSLISVLPLSLSLVRSVRMIPYIKDQNDSGVPPVSVNAMRNLRKAVAKDEYVFSDIPWAVAWYADREAVWLPTDLPSMVDLIANRKKVGDKCAGIVLSAETLNQPFFSGIASSGNDNDAYAHLTFEIIEGSMREQRRRYELSGLNIEPSIRNMTGPRGMPLFLYPSTED